MSLNKILVFTLVIIGLSLWIVNAQPSELCKALEIRRQILRESCPSNQYSETKECNFRHCLKLPGELCGEHLLTQVIHGVCISSSLICCGKCVGCYDGKCYSDVNCNIISHKTKKTTSSSSRYMTPLINNNGYFNKLLNRDDNRTMYLQQQQQLQQPLVVEPQQLQQQQQQEQSSKNSVDYYYYSDK